MYYSEYGGSNGGEISRINVTGTNPTPTSIINSLELITGISVNGNDMYITEENTGTIYKYTDSSLGIADTTYPKITISPNPSSNIIKVEGVRSPIKYTIHTITSNVIQKGVLSFDKTIDIKDLASGIYFLKFENKAVKKIIKK